MNKYERLSLTLCVVGFVAVFLPTAFARSCYSCPSDPLLSPAQCNRTNTIVSCSETPARCFAATAELTNGTVIGYKGCWVSGTCNNDSTDCNKTITDVSFKNCSAYCCDGDKCNQQLPMLSSISTTTPTPTTKPDGGNPSATGIKIKAFYYLPIFLLVIIQIMS